MKKTFITILLTLNLSAHADVPEVCNPYVAQCNKVIEAYKSEGVVLRESLSACKEERRNCIELLKKTSSGGFLGIPSEAWIAVGIVSGFVGGVWVGGKLK